ncbi:MAG: hypothetical protein ACYCOU_11575, partial [Sulfobacillus sp.]
GASKTGDSPKTLAAKAGIPTALVLAVATEPGAAMVSTLEGLHHISIAETLGDEWNMDSNNFWRPGERDQALHILKGILVRAGVSLEGFKKGTWSVAFQHGVPNNSSPVYSANWRPLIERRKGA